MGETHVSSGCPQGMHKIGGDHWPIEICPIWDRIGRLAANHTRGREREMKKYLWAAASLSLMLTAGCATEGYVREQVAPLADRLGKLEARVGALETKVDGLAKDMPDVQAAKKEINDAKAQVEQAVKAAQGAEQNAMAAASRAEAAANRAEDAAKRAEAAEMKGATSAKKATKAFELQQKK